MQNANCDISVQRREVSSGELIVACSSNQSLFERRLVYDQIHSPVTRLDEWLLNTCCATYKLGVCRGKQNGDQLCMKRKVWRLACERRLEVLVKRLMGSASSQDGVGRWRVWIRFSVYEIIRKNGGGDAYRI